MPEYKIPLLLVSKSSMFWLGRRFRPFGRMLAMANPQLASIFFKLSMETEAEGYAMGSFISASAYSLIFSIFAAMVLWLRYHDMAQVLLPTIATGFSIWALFFLLFMVYPGIIMRKIAAKESKDLLFALREMLIDIEGGVPLFDSIKNVAAGDYGYVSQDLEIVVKQIERGVPEGVALRDLAVSTESEYMKRALWQIVNALESGASLVSALSSIVLSIQNYIYSDIKAYSSNLNFLMLLYMLAATVIPSLGITFLVLLSAFSGLGVNFGTLLLLLGFSVLIQVIMIGYMSSTRPEIFGG